jgi:hypothetical protein
LLRSAISESPHRMDALAEYKLFQANYIQALIPDNAIEFPVL